MKIGFVLDDGLDKPDGVQQYILTLGEWFTTNGHEVRYLVGETKRTNVADGVYPIPKNIHVKFNGNSLSIPLPASSQKIRAILAKEQFDVLHVQVPYSPFFGGKVVRLASSETAVVGTFHILPYGWLSRVGTYLLGASLQRNLKRFDAHVSVSSPAAEFAAQTFKISSRVVPNSIPIKAFQRKTIRKPSSEQLRILFLGRLVERKGCLQFLRALEVINSSGALPAGTTVHICGDGPMRAQLEQYVAKHKMAALVTFHGFVTHEEKLEQMQTADISVFPSLGGESFGIVLIEAMAAGGGVVLGGDNPGYRSVLEDVPGSIIEANVPSMFAGQLVELITRPEKRAELYKAQQKHVLQFDTPIVGQKLLQIYQSCKSARTSE